MKPVYPLLAAAATQAYRLRELCTPNAELITIHLELESPGTKACSAECLDKQDPLDDCTGDVCSEYREPSGCSRTACLVHREAMLVGGCSNGACLLDATDVDLCKAVVPGVKIFAGVRALRIRERTKGRGDLEETRVSTRVTHALALHDSFLAGNPPKARYDGIHFDISELESEEDVAALLEGWQGPGELALTMDYVQWPPLGKAITQHCAVCRHVFVRTTEEEASQMTDMQSFGNAKVSLVPRQPFQRQGELDMTDAIDYSFTLPGHLSACPVREGLVS